MPTTSKQYYDDNGGLVFVSCGNRNGANWKTVRQKTTLSGLSRLISPALPIRKKSEDAQSDLDAYALKKGWELAE